MPHIERRLIADAEDDVLRRAAYFATPAIYAALRHFRLRATPRCYAAVMPR